MLTAILYITGLPPYRSEKCAIGGESVLPLEGSWDLLGMRTYSNALINIQCSSLSWS